MINSAGDGDRNSYACMHPIDVADDTFPFPIVSRLRVVDVYQDS